MSGRNNPPAKIPPRHLIVSTERAGALVARGLKAVRGKLQAPVATQLSTEADNTAAAASAKSLDELRTLLENFRGCELRNTATQLVFADGDPHARVMFVGEAPGYSEHITGRPFVGRSGKLLNHMLEAIGLDRTKAYFAYIVPWWSPEPLGNRMPSSRADYERERDRASQEIAVFLPFIRRHIELVDPDIVVCLGVTPTQALLGKGFTQTRGRWLKYDSGGREIRAIATYHPAFLLRSPLQKRLAWRDFLALKKALAVELKLNR